MDIRIPPPKIKILLESDPPNPQNLSMEIVAVVASGASRGADYAHMIHTINTCICIHTCIWVYVYVYVHVYIYIYIYIYMYTCTYTYTYTHIHVCMHIHVLIVCII